MLLGSYWIAIRVKIVRCVIPFSVFSTSHRMTILLAVFGRIINHLLLGRLFILDKFKPDWVRDIHPGRGGKTIIQVYPASKWMAKHWDDIDWEAKI